MVRRAKNPLTSMSGVEKRFIRRFVDERLIPAGVRRKEMPELKRDALERFRAANKVKCAEMADDFIETILGEEDFEGIHIEEGYDE